MALKQMQNMFDITYLISCIASSLRAAEELIGNRPDDVYMLVNDKNNNNNKTHKPPVKEVHKSVPATCSHTSLQSSSASFGANKSDTVCAKEITQSFSDQELLQKESEFSFVASSSIDFENKLDIIMSKLDNISFEVGKVSSKMQKNLEQIL